MGGCACPQRPGVGSSDSSTTSAEQIQTFSATGSISLPLTLSGILPFRAVPSMLDLFMVFLNLISEVSCRGFENWGCIVTSIIWNCPHRLNCPGLFHLDNITFL